MRAGVISTTLAEKTGIGVAAVPLAVADAAGCPGTWAVLSTLAAALSTALSVILLPAFRINPPNWAEAEARGRATRSDAPPARRAVRRGRSDMSEDRDWWVAGTASSRGGGEPGDYSTSLVGRSPAEE